MTLHYTLSLLHVVVKEKITLRSSLAFGRGPFA